MRVSLRWLEDYVRVDVPVAKLVELLDLSGTKVETVNAPGDRLDGVTVARVTEVAEHPNADNLTLVTVETGSGAERVVCGATNFAVGDRVPYARPGARLGDLEIAERKIRGELSRGMLCSAAELQVAKDASGLMILPADSELGSDIVTTLGLDDTILELEITPNRPDCMGMIGVAREVAALLGNELRIPDAPAVARDDVPLPVKVTLDDAQGCPRYVAHLLDNVEVGPSQSWMARRLLAAGVRPISHVVDATNYVLLETGHPLHAFDAAHVHERSIHVRKARRGEKLTTLDGVERVLEETDLVIADPTRALALAGIMGGRDSEVSAATTDVILEAAYFDPETIGRTSRRLGLRTEASARFERGTDPDALPFAAARCANLIRSTSEPSAQVVDEYPVTIVRRRVTLRPARTERLLGYQLGAAAQAKHLRSIELVVDENDEVLDVEVPLFRPDITSEVDLIEEVARLAGFDRLSSTLPKGAAGGLDRLQVAERNLRRTLVGFGLSEAWTSSLDDARALDALELDQGHPARRMVAIDNPMSEREDKMRSSVLPGLLRAAARNVAQRAPEIALFEIAHVFEPADGRLPSDPLVLGAVFSGTRQAKSWMSDATEWDFFAAKGVLIAGLRSLGVEASVAPTSGMPYHPTRVGLVSIGDGIAGSLGELHPKVCRNWDVAEGTVALEVSLGPVFAALPGRPLIEELTKFPPVVIDLAFVVDEEVASAAVEAAIRRAGQPELASVRLFDLYRGEQIPPGKKSLAYALEVRVPDRTLTDEEATQVRDRIVTALAGDLDAQLRA
ncbi:MAG TPA: phenylalanine--tRNA ligase subunit beta [Actinomycetota bacterium]|nr:phenylalanine--tRNA ligase subunit beta [Actinomycetota bacterium]